MEWKGEKRMEPVPTRVMARILGPFMAIIGCAVALRADAMTLILPGFLKDAPLVLITGVFTLALGLVIIVAHQRWDSAAAIVISVLGWITAIRGALLLLASDFVATVAPYVVHSRGALMLIGGVIALIGLWLTRMGWLSGKAA